MKSFTLFISGLFLSSSLMAAAVDTAQTKFTWTATKKMSAGHTGTVPLKSHDVKFDDKGNITGGEFVIGLSEMDVTDLSGEWKDKFLAHVKGGDFFEVEKYPTAKLVVTSVSGDTAKGKLTIKDKTQDVSVKFKKEGKNYTGKLVFDRTKFGVIYGSGNFFKELTADKVINNDVTVDFTLAVK